ncbi:hypothetical protein ACJX0J_024065, partial [Zea mays]
MKKLNNETSNLHEIRLNIYLQLRKNYNEGARDMFQAILQMTIHDGFTNFLYKKLEQPHEWKHHFPPQIEQLFSYGGMLPEAKTFSLFS